jgi:hypothetical protein
MIQVVPIAAVAFVQLLQVVATVPATAEPACALRS